MREDVNHLKSECRKGNLSRRLVAAKLYEDGNQMKLKASMVADRKFENVVKSAQDAAVLVLVY